MFNFFWYNANMKNLFLSYGLPIDEGQISKLNSFGSYLKEVNQVMNLTTVTDDGEMWIKHFLDSIVGAEFFPENANCCEIGSGGGFPSIPLKIYREDLSFTLIESTGKKCDYLNKVSEYLQFDNVKVVCGRAEELSKTQNFREAFDVVTARAVARMNTLCEYCIPFVKKGGIFVAYKGEAEEELKEAQNAINVLGGKVREVKSLTLPNDSGVRNIIVIEKIKETPLKYPRGNGKERKKPL